MLDIGKMTETDILNCYKSWKGTVIIDHNACHKTLRNMDLLYNSLFTKHEPEKRIGRNELCTDIYSNLNAKDLNTLFNF